MRSKCCQAAIFAGNTSCTPRKGSMILLKARSDQPVGRALRDCTPPADAPWESRRRTPSAPASKRATSPDTNCGPIATARWLISSCTPLAKPRYTRMGPRPSMLFTLLARPLPANTWWPAASCTSTHESAEKLRRRCARPVPAVSASGEAVCVAGSAETVPGDDDAAGDDSPVNAPDDVGPGGAEVEDEDKAAA